MGLSIQLARRAERDFRQIETYVAARSPKGAERVRFALVETIERVASLPLIGPATSSGSVRTIVVTQLPYRIYYRVEHERILILHIRHTARKPVDPAKLST